MAKKKRKKKSHAGMIQVCRWIKVKPKRKKRRSKRKSSKKR